MSEQDILYQNFSSEIQRGVNTLIVLSLLQKPSHGYQLVRELADLNLPLEGNTLYPMLRRLEEQGLLKSSWETGADKPRKNYSLTRAGKAMYERLKSQWYRTIARVHDVIEEADNAK